MLLIDHKKLLDDQKVDALNAAISEIQQRLININKKQSFLMVFHGRYSRDVNLLVMLILQLLLRSKIKTNLVKQRYRLLR